jgi:D-mannonate dehydratase
MTSRETLNNECKAPVSPDPANNLMGTDQTSPGYNYVGVSVAYQFR